MATFGYDRINVRTVWKAKNMIKVYWQDKSETIIRLDYYDPVETWDEYLDANRESFRMMRAKSHKVHVIHNPGSVDMPGGYPLPYIRKALDLAPYNAGKVAMIISNRFARRMMRLILRLTLNPDDFYFVSDLNSALDLVREDQQQA